MKQSTVNWYVFPIAVGAKKPPLVDDNLALGASNDPRRIAAWRKEHPNANWGVALRRSNLLVVDIDRKAGKRGALTYAELDFEHGFPKTYSVRTPSGGVHLYYRGPHVFALGKYGFGVDVDSPNYVLLPGSRLMPPAGRGVYRVMNNLPVAAAPSWFYEVLGERHQQAPADQTPVVDLDQPENTARAIHYLKTGAPVSRQGDGGEKTLFDVACRLKDMGISEWQAVQLLAAHYNDKCDPPWNISGGAVADDLAVKVHNAFTYGTQNAPGFDTAEHHFAADPVNPDDIAGLLKLDRKRDAQHRRRRAERPVRMPVVDGYAKTGRYVMVDGVRVPLVEDLP
jgi:hypothetical protein